MKYTNRRKSKLDSDTFYISQIFPISFHEKYKVCFEYSDNIILPPSVFFSIKSMLLPLPPLFSISYLKTESPPIICGALSFTAPENTVFCPSWILKKMNKKTEYGNQEAIIEVLKPKKNRNCVYPAAKRIEVFCKDPIDTNTCRTGLCRYTVISKGEWLSISTPSNISKIYISGLFPKNKCIIKAKTFEIVFTEKVPNLPMIYESVPSVNLMIESIHLRYLKKIKNIPKEAPQTVNYSPYSYQVQKVPPIRFDTNTFVDSDLLPWDKEDNLMQDPFHNDLLHTESFEKQAKKTTSMAFPNIKFSETRPLTTTQINENYKRNSLPSAHKKLGFKLNNNVSYYSRH